MAIIVMTGFLVQPSLAQTAGDARPHGARRHLDMADIITRDVASALALRPDGGEVAFVISRADTTLNRFVGDIWSVAIEWLPEGEDQAGQAGMDEPSRRQWTRTSDIEADLAWSPVGRVLAFRSRRSSGLTVRGDRIDSTQSARSQVWVQRRPEESARRLTRGTGDVDGFRWLGDGTAVVYKARRTETSEKGSAGASRNGFDGRITGADARPWEFWRQPLDGRAAVRLLTADAGVGDWDVTSDGRRIVFASHGGDPLEEESPTDLWLFDLRDSTTTRLTHRWGPDTEPTFSPDGRSIVWKADQDTAITFSQEELWVMEIDRREEARCLTRDLDVAITRPRWTGMPGVVAIECAGSLGNTIELLDVHSGRTRNAGGLLFPVPVINGEGFHVASFDVGLSCSADGTRGIALCERGGGEQIVNALYLSLDDSPEAPESAWPDLAARFELLTASKPDARRQFTSSSDGTSTESFLILPDSTLFGPGPYPTITQLHGGPYNRNTARLRDNATALVLASHGYLVYLPNFRGSKGYGNAFGTATRRDFAEGPYRDVMAGLDSLIARGLADSSRLGIMGGSYGGYLTMWSITRSDRFKAAVSMYGFSSLITDFGNGQSPSYELEFLGDPYWKGNRLWTDLSPAWHVDQIHTPLLLLHGENDPAVGISNSREIWTALTVLRRPVEFITYPREGHGFREPNHRIDAARRTVAWFDRWLR